MKYRKLPVEIEALIWDGGNLEDLKSFGTPCSIVEGALTIFTLEGNMEATTGDYIIKGVKGEFYPCKPDIFKLTYEEV